MSNNQQYVAVSKKNSHYYYRLIGEAVTQWPSGGSPVHHCRCSLSITMPGSRNATQLCNVLSYLSQVCEQKPNPPRDNYVQLLPCLLNLLGILPHSIFMTLLLLSIVAFCHAGYSADLIHNKSTCYVLTLFSLLLKTGNRRTFSNEYKMLKFCIASQFF